MILYVNGDSNSAGAEMLDKKQAWPVLLAQKLDCSLINVARSGASNDRILRTTQEFLANKPRNVFVVIGWTSWEREEWIYHGNYYNVNASGHTQLPEAIMPDYKQWVTQQNDQERKFKSQQFHKKIYLLHQQLIQAHIPHLFFNALMPFQHEENQNWNDCYLGPYENDLSYYWYLKKQGFEPTPHNHYLETAQKFWADVLSNYIEKKQLL